LLIFQCFKKLPECYLKKICKIPEKLTQISFFVGFYLKTGKKRV